MLTITMMIITNMKISFTFFFSKNKVNNKMAKDTFYSKMMQLSENEEILDLIKDKKKLNTAYKKARDSIKNR